MRLSLVKYFTILIMVLLFYNNKRNYNVLVFRNIKEHMLVDKPNHSSFNSKINNVKPKKSILFPLQKPFSIMKSGNNIEKFIFNIDRKKVITRKGIQFYKVFFYIPFYYEKNNFLLGIKKDRLFTAFSDKNIGGIDYFFSYNERIKREIGFIAPDKNFYLLALDSVYKSDDEYIYKIDYKYDFMPFPSEESIEKDEYNFLPEWEIKEMYYTKKRGLIKAVVKNNKSNLIYIALPD